MADPALQGTAVDVHDPADPIGLAVDDPLDDQASTAVSHEHDIAFEHVDQLDDSIDVVVEGGTGLRSRRRKRASYT